jgi:hypothetical protein
MVDARVRHQRGAGLVAVAGDDVDHAGRETDFGGQLGQRQDGHAGILGRLDDAGVARRQRAAHRAAEYLQRIIPRDDVPGHAQRLAQRHDRVAGLVGNGVAMQLVAGAGIELEIAGHRGGVGAGLSQRLAAIARLELREFLDPLGQRQRQPVHQPAALGGRHQAPLALERGTRGVHRELDVGCVAAGDLVILLAVGRVDDRNRLARRRGNPAVADVMLVGHVAPLYTLSVLVGAPSNE